MNVDAMNILSLREDPAAMEAIIAAQHATYPMNPSLRALLDSIYLEPDRDHAFERFIKSFEFRIIRKILNIFSISSHARLCEIGGGPGFLAWALARTGFTCVELLEPNALPVTGTGYLRSRQDSASLIIHNEIERWHAQSTRYDAIITKNCIHHFKNISQAAASIRQKMDDGALWFAFREWFADTPAELYAKLAAHPYCQAFGVYEWPYPSRHYVESIELAGFTLRAIIPAGYANNALGLYQEDEGSADTQALTNRVDQLLATDRAATVQAFWDENAQNRFRREARRFFSRPQLFVFERTPI